VSVRAATEDGKLSATVNGGPVGGAVAVPASAAWAEVRLGKVALLAGRNTLVVRSDGGAALVKTVRFAPR
jgi:hypothetical protein